MEHSRVQWFIVGQECLVTNVLVIRWQPPAHYIHGNAFNTAGTNLHHATVPTSTTCLYIMPILSSI